MKRLVILLAVVAMAFGISSCSKTSTPSDTVKASYECIQAGDFEKAVKDYYYEFNAEKPADFTEEDQKQSDAMLAMLCGKAQQSMEAKGGLTSFEIGDEKISEDGLTAEVEVKCVFGNGEEETDSKELEKLNDKWYIKM